jgi:hypothetical protein
MRPGPCPRPTQLSVGRAQFATGSYLVTYAADLLFKFSSLLGVSVRTFLTNPLLHPMRLS